MLQFCPEKFEVNVMRLKKTHAGRNKVQIKTIEKDLGKRDKPARDANAGIHRTSTPQCEQSKNKSIR